MPDLAAEAALIGFLAETAPQLSCLHDAAEGGLAVALAECAIASGVGAELELPSDAVTLFGEGGGLAIAACHPDIAGRLSAEAPLRRIGTVGGETVIGVSVRELTEAYSAGLQELLA
jgi:phosphoribosylformylglycinamidine synthase